MYELSEGVELEYVSSALKCSHRTHTSSVMRGLFLDGSDMIME
jgi:hypothetical protein